MAEPKTYTWEVTGNGVFPFDMLRYDRCWPKHQSDVSVIEATTRRGSLQRYVTIELESLHKNPTYGRWSSFGWEASK